MVTTPDKKAAALRYAARGWPVFPLWWPVDGRCACAKPDCGKNAGKHPLAPLAPRGLKNATTDAATVERWWTRYPLANIGLRTGVAFDVFDIDNDDVHEGTERLPVFDMPGGPVSRTGGGWHFLVLPTGASNRARFDSFGAPGGHCDWRGDGGYIVAPPSLHYSGRRYEWHASEDLPINKAPRALVDALTYDPPPPPRPAPSTSPYMTVWTYGTGTSGAGIEAIVQRVSQAPQGKRNELLWWAARLLGLKVYRCELSKDAGERARDALLRAASSAGLSESEAQATLKSGWGTGRKGIAGKVPQA